jgi:hypothetical protein
VNDPVEAGEKIPLVLDEPILAPTRSIIPLTDEQIMQVARSYAPIDQSMQLALGNVTTILRAGDVLSPWQQFALNLIGQSIDERPIYFASSGNAAATLGLSPYLVREGLAFRLHNGPLDQAAGIGPEATGPMMMEPSAYSPVIGEWVDVARTTTLLEAVFIHRAGLPDDWSHWPDIATIGIPSYYGWAYLALAQAAIQADDDESLDRFQARAEAWLTFGL